MEIISEFNIWGVKGCVTSSGQKCDLCCKAFRISPLKEAGQPCKYQLRQKTDSRQIGCEIYNRRDEAGFGECVEYECAGEMPYRKKWLLKQALLSGEYSKEDINAALEYATECGDDHVRLFIERLREYQDLS